MHSVSINQGLLVSGHINKGLWSHTQNLQAYLQLSCSKSNKIKISLHQMPCVSTFLKIPKHFLNKGSIWNIGSGFSDVYIYCHTISSSLNTIQCIHFKQFDITFRKREKKITKSVLLKNKSLCKSWIVQGFTEQHHIRNHNCSCLSSWSNISARISTTINRVQHHPCSTSFTWIARSAKL